MSFKNNEEPKAFLIWNRHHLMSPTTIVGRESTPVTPAAVEGLTRFNFFYETEASEQYSPLNAGDITSMNEATEFDELEEIERSVVTSRSPVYNIIQNKLNLCEKRGPKFNCRVCHYVGHTRLSMITHMKMHLRPFCEVCFHLFESKKAVHNHIQANHPEVMIREPPSSSRDFYCSQMVAPPNTPNPTSDDEMIPLEDLLNPVGKVAIGVAAVQKLLSTEETDGAVSTEDEQRLTIDEQQSVPGSSRRRAKTKSTLKRPLKKKHNKSKLKDVSNTPDNVMKKITSRFGRSISLKMPQF